MAFFLSMRRPRPKPGWPGPAEPKSNKYRYSTPLGRIQPPRRPPTVAPYAGRSDKDMWAEADRLTKARMSPLVDYYRSAIEARSKAGQQAITAYAQVLAGLLGSYAPKVQAAYDQALQAAKLLAAGGSQQLKQSGADVAQTTEGAIKQAGQEVPSDINLSQIGEGAAGAYGAIGEAGIEALSAGKSAQSEYYGSLPGIAGLLGLQYSRRLQAQLNDELARELSALNAQAPGIAQDIYRMLVEREDRRKAMLEDQRRYNLEQKQRLRDYWAQRAMERSQLEGVIWVPVGTRGIRPLDADPKTPGIQHVPLWGAAVQQQNIGLQQQGMAAKTAAQQQEIIEQKRRERERAVRERNKAWSRIRANIYKDAQKYIDSHPNFNADKNPGMYKVIATSLMRKYAPDVLRYTSKRGRAAALKKLEGWIRAALHQPRNPQPTTVTVAVPPGFKP